MRVNTLQSLTYRLVAFMLVLVVPRLHELIRKWLGLKKNVMQTELRGAFLVQFIMAVNVVHTHDSDKETIIKQS